MKYIFAFDFSTLERKSFNLKRPGTYILLLFTLNLSFSFSLYSQTNVFPDSGKVGIGTTNPNSPLHVSSNATGLISLQKTYGGLGHFEIGMPHGHFGIGNYPISGSGNTFFVIDRGGNVGIGYGAYSSNFKGKLVINGNVGIGTKDPQYLLAVNGTIGAKEIIVNSEGWADYVFKPTYDLMPLNELNAFIQKNRHLPNIPTENEVVERGVNLLEMNIKLLEKIEELTLYLINLQEQNNEQNRLINNLLSKSSSD